MTVLAIEGAVVHSVDPLLEVILFSTATTLTPNAPLVEVVEIVRRRYDQNGGKEDVLKH